MGSRSYMWYYKSKMEEIDILKKAGLNDGQAKVYCSLLSSGSLTPVQISKETGETRENCYLICKKLVDMGLIQRTDAKKVTYAALNPSNLEILAEKRRKIVQKNEKILKDNMSSLLNIFYANNELPGSRTYEGIEGIKEVYLDALRVKKDVYLLRTKADGVLGGDYMMDSFLRKYRDQLPILGIHTYALTPFTKRYSRERDEEINFHRVWMEDGMYDAPVAIHVYGEKVAFVAFGEQLMATVITSPLISEAVRQMIKMMMEYCKLTIPQEL